MATPDPRAARLAQLETVVQKHLAAFVEAGGALAEIQAQQLYRATHATFAHYLEERWGMTARRAYQLIAAAAAAENVKHVSPITPNARQAAELAAAPPIAQPGIWAQAVDQAPTDSKGKPAVTAGQVAELVASKAPRKRRAKKAPKPTRLRVPGAIVIIERRSSDVDLAEALRQALHQVEVNAMTSKRNAA